MSYNPRVHGSDRRRKTRPAIDPRAGVKHSTTVGKHGPVGVSPVDVSNRVATPNGWRIPYYSGDTIEVYYELLCARNSTGLIKHEKKDRIIRVLAGQLFVTHDGVIESVLTNQVCSFPHGTEYAIASPGDSDVELFVTQDKDYESELEHVTAADAINAEAVYPFEESHSGLSRVSPEKAAIEAGKRREARDQVRSGKKPVPRRPNLPGQQVAGFNPRPIGAGGFGDD